MAKYALGCLGIIAIGFIIFILLIGGCTAYNGLVQLSQDVDSKWAQVETDYQRRADLIPNLVNTVAGAANFEKSTLIAVTDARASVGQVKLDPSKAPTDPAAVAPVPGGAKPARRRALAAAGGLRAIPGAPGELEFPRLAGGTRGD